jgi:hypothetical protein
MSYALVPLFVVAAVVVPAGIASAAPGVSIDASRQWLTFGQTTQITGTIEPAAAGETVRIFDQDGSPRGHDTTDAQGRYSVTLKPQRNARIHAEWLAHSSESLKLNVRPLLTLAMGVVRLFGDLTARGRMQPSVDTGRVTITLLRDGDPIASRRVRPSDGAYTAKFGIKQPGSHYVKVAYSGDGFTPSRARSAAASPRMPSLGVGSRSGYVRDFERRLMKLGYRLSGVNRSYTQTTADAVRAFNKVQGRSRVGSATESTWRALAAPRIPKPRFRFPRYHVEVDQTRQVLYRVRSGRVITVLHVSTGAGGATRDGTFTFYRRLNGYSPGRLYHPVYFDGLRAIHGWPEVPTYPASHGCVRVPMWIAEWMNSKVALGDKIMIYH